jgi:hypothetical protein
VLSWDLRWFARAGVDTQSADYELRNAYVSELKGFVPVTKMDVIALTTSVGVKADVSVCSCAFARV